MCVFVCDVYGYIFMYLVIMIPVHCAMHSVHVYYNYLY